MKKLLVMLAMMAVTTVASAYDFELDQYGGCTIADKVQTSKSPADAYGAAKGWLNSQGFSAMTPGADKAGEMFSSTVTMNTKTAYNPFAGQFIENLVYSIALAGSRRTGDKCMHVQTTVFEFNEFTRSLS